MLQDNLGDDKKEKLKIFMYITSQPQYDKNPYDDDGKTVMHWAADYNKTDIIKYYIKNLTISDPNPKRITGEWHDISLL